MVPTGPDLTETEAPPQVAAPHRFAIGLLAASLTALVVLLSIYPIASPDTWWHLEAGEYIVAHRTIPLVDVFSFTAQGKRWITHEWLFEIGAWLVHQLGGLDLLIVSKALLVLLGFGLWWWFFRLCGVSAVTGAITIALFAPLVTYHAYERPHLFTNLFATVFAIALLWYREASDRRQARRVLLLLLPVQLVWANLHAGMVLGPALMLAFVVCEALQVRLAARLNWFAPSRVAPSEWKFLLAMLAGLTGLCFVNPNLHHAVIYPFTIAGDPLFKQGITELRPVFSSPGFQAADAFWLFLAMVVLGALSFVRARRCVSLWSLCLFACATLAALMAVRNVELFAMLAGPVVALNLRAPFTMTQSERPLRLFMASAVILSLIAVVLIRGVDVGGTQRKPALGYDTSMVPAGAATFVEQHPISGQVFNSMEFGGYLIWRWHPQRLVYADGRLDVFGAGHFQEYLGALRSEVSPDYLARQYQLGAFLLRQPQRAVPNYLGRTLARAPGWRLVYFDQQALLYVKDDDAHRALIAQNGYRAVVPLMLGEPVPSSFDPQQILREAERAAAAQRDPLTLSVLGFAQMLAAQRAAAKQSFTAALALDPSFGLAQEGLQRAGR
jgi:hypothetical protein